MAPGKSELLVVSDTHGDAGALAAALSWAARRGIVEGAFLGDGCADLEPARARARSFPRMRAVRGNGDFDEAVPLMAALEFRGRRFLLMHGHSSGVADGLGPAVAAARSAGAAAVLFGHTHRPFWEEIDGVLALNPGSASRPRGAFPPTFATIACPEAAWFDVRFWALERASFGGYRVRPFAFE